MSNQQAHRNGFSIYQCKAETGCPKAINNTSQIAIEIEKLLIELDFDEFIREKFGNNLLKHHVFDIVFSGCPNGCSKPQINDVGIMGRSEINIINGACIGCMKCITACKEHALTWDGSQINIDESLCIGCSDCIAYCPARAIRETRKGYRIIAGGRLGRHPQLAMEVVPFVEDQEVVSVVRGLVQYFREYANKEERLADVVARLGIESVREYLQNSKEEKTNKKNISFI